MLARCCFVLAVLGASFLAPVAAADGPMFVSQDGVGLVQGSTRYVAVGGYPSNATELLAISTKDGIVRDQLSLTGQWGLPFTPAGNEGLSRDGSTLVLGSAQVGLSSPSTFLVLKPATLRVVRTIALDGYFSYDALSPNASRLYLIQYTRGRTNDTSRYVVRGYDLRTNRLLPGRIADRTQKGWVMQGYPVARTWSADGRWVYTLYSNPGGYPFVHALDTVRGVAHCIGLPWAEEGNQNAVWNLGLAVRNGGRTLAVHWRSGRPWLDIAVGTWRISYPRAGFPWAWIGAGIGGGLALLLPGVLRLRRRGREELREHARQEPGLA